MTNLNQYLNWLTITASGLCATLLLVSGAQATTPITTTPTSDPATVTQLNTKLLVAAKKKQPRKKKVKRKVIKTKVIKTQIKASTSPQTELTQTPPPTPPAPSVSPTPAVTPPAPTVPTETPTPKVETPAPNPFSLTTKLEGQVIFGATGTFTGDFERNPAFGHRTRLELKTDINGGTLTTRIQAVGLGLSNQNVNANTTGTTTAEGNLSWTDGTTTSSVGIDALKYEFALTPQTQVVVAANAGAADDFTDTINPYFDGDGASGSISAFGNRPSIYYTVSGVGVGIRHKLSDTTELSLGYLANDGQIPAAGSGLFGGGYGAIAQLTFQTGENSKVGVTYTRTLNSAFGTGSNNAENLGGNSNNFGLQGSFQLSPQFALGGWAGYTQNQSVAGVDRQIWNWAITAALPDLGGKGNLAGFLVGQEPRVAFASDGSADTKSGLHIEGFYQFKVSENLSITPGIIYLTAPNQDANSSGAVIGALRTTFTF
jgi:Carbohydrate-selective porin, OprB family